MIRLLARLKKYINKLWEKEALPVLLSWIETKSMDRLCLILDHLASNLILIFLLGLGEKKLLQA